jgi:hypothetical protein
MSSLIWLGLTPAERARTIVAAGTWLRWATDSEDCLTPYVEEGGSPVLLVERVESERILRRGYTSTESAVLPSLGRVRLGGEPWPVAGGATAAAAQQFRVDRADCVECCGPRRTHLVCVRLDRVEIMPADGERFETIDLDAYEAAQPDTIIARSPHVISHLNTEHADELVVLASHLTGQSRSALAAASVQWIDARGIELSLIDHTGARDLRFPFRRPLSTMDELGHHLHRLLNGLDAGQS